MILKTCTHCHKDLPEDSFPTEKARGRTYRRWWCRECLVEYYRVRAARVRRVKQMNAIREANP